MNNNLSVKKLSFIFSAFLLQLLSGYSQITITQADMPDANDTLRVSFSNDTLDPSLTGANYVWNYAYLTPNIQWLRKFDAPSAFPPPFNLVFNWLNTSYGEQQYTPDSIGQLKPDDAYFFFRETSATFRQVGSGLTVNSVPFPIMYNPHDTIYHFPLQYLNKDSSDAVFGFQIPPPPSTGLYYGQNIHRVNEADGWGTLLTPFGTFQALRIKSIVSIRDTFADTSGNGYSLPRPPRYEFKWLVQGGKIPYLQVDANDVGGNIVVTNITYRDSMRGVPQLGIYEAGFSEFRIFPNPADEIIFMEYSLREKTFVKTELYDCMGKRNITVFNNRQDAGKHLQIIPVAHLVPGPYYLSVTEGQQKFYKKVIIQHCD